MLFLAAMVGVLIVATEATAFALVIVTITLLGIHFARLRSLRALLARFWVISLFAASIYALQAVTHRTDWKVALRIVFVFAAVRLLSELCTARGIPVPHQRPLYRLFLFLHFTRHFTAILLEEAKRLLIARRLAAPKLYGAGGFSSLVHSLNAILRRSLVRAERFYAAQWLRGIEA
jgi:hypothetical protein